MMANTARTEVERLRQRSDVKQALKQASGSEQQDTLKHTGQVWFAGYATLFLVLVVLDYLTRVGIFGAVHGHAALLQRLILVSIASVMLLAGLRITKVYLLSRLENPVAKYNLWRILNLAVVLGLVFLVASLLFQNLYTAFVSLGLISLVLGFALQTPITSLIGWIYILVRTPYRVGDRIKIGDAKGDVIDVSYIDTTLWEFGGDLLSSDHPSGRIIKFPNSHVLSSEVYNYTWPVFPYIWNEVKLSVAYESDLEYVAETMQRVAEEEVGRHMSKQVHIYREILAQTPVDQLEVREHPAVFFRTNANTWLDAIVRYLVHPKEAGRVKSRLIKRLLKELTAEPERVLFPKSNAR